MPRANRVRGRSTLRFPRAKKLICLSFAKAASRWAALYSGWQAVSTSLS